MEKSMEKLGSSRSPMKEREMSIVSARTERFFGKKRETLEGMEKGINTP